MEILLFILGAIFGSFYLVIGTRLPLKENVLFGRSRCDNCKTELKWYELIPIVSYILLLGKCKNCHKKISISHLLVEIICGLLFLIGYIYYGLNYELIIYLVLVSATILIFITDFKYMIILDSTWIIGSILIIITKLIFISYDECLLSVLSGVSLFIIMYFIKIFGDKIFKRESLGGGDIKLSFLIGLTVGFRLGLISLIFASFLALPYALGQVWFNKKNELPYGPFLIAATLIIFIFIEKFANLLVLFELS